MQDHLETYLRDEAAVIDGDHTDLQRGALRELIKLSAESVEPAESQVEQQYQAAKAKAEASLVMRVPDEAVLGRLVGRCWDVAPLIPDLPGARRGIPVVGQRKPGKGAFLRFSYAHLELGRRLLQ